MLPPAVGGGMAAAPAGEGVSGLACAGGHGDRWSPRLMSRTAQICGTVSASDVQIHVTAVEICRSEVLRPEEQCHLPMSDLRSSCRTLMRRTAQIR